MLKQSHCSTSLQITILLPNISNSSFVLSKKQYHDYWIGNQDNNSEFLPDEENEIVEDIKAERVIQVANKLTSMFKLQKGKYFDMEQYENSSVSTEEKREKQAIFKICNISFKNILQKQKEVSETQNFILKHNPTYQKECCFRIELLKAQVNYVFDLVGQNNIGFIEGNTVHKIMCRTNALLKRKDILISYFMLKCEDYILNQLISNQLQVFNKQRTQLRDNYKISSKLQQQLEYYKQRQDIFASNAYIDLILILYDSNNYAQNETANQNMPYNLTKRQIFTSFKYHQKYKQRIIEQFRCLQLCVDVLNNGKMKCLKQASISQLLKFLYFHFVNINNDNTYSSDWQHSYDLLTTITQDNINKWEHQKNITTQEELIFRVFMTMVNEIQYDSFSFNPTSELEEQHIKFNLHYNSKNLMINFLRDKQAYDYKLCIFKQNAKTGVTKYRKYYNLRSKSEENHSESEQSESTYKPFQETEDFQNIICAHQVFPRPTQADNLSQFKNGHLNIHGDCIVNNKEIYDSQNNRRFKQQIIDNLETDTTELNIPMIYGKIRYLWQIGLEKYQRPLPVVNPKYVVSLAISKMQLVSVAGFNELKCLSLSSIIFLNSDGFQTLKNLTRCFFYDIEFFDQESQMAQPLVDCVKYWPHLQSLNLKSLGSFHTLTFSYSLKNLQQLVIQYLDGLENVIIDLDKADPIQLETLLVEPDGNINSMSVKFEGAKKILQQLQFIECPGREQLFKYTLQHQNIDQ